MDFLQYLQSQEVLSSEALTTLRQKVEETGLSIESAALEAGVPATQLKKLYSEYYGIPIGEYSDNTPPPNEVLQYIPEESARHYSVIPLKIEDEVLVVGVNDPEDYQVKEVLNFISSKNQRPYKLAFLLKSELQGAFKAYESLRGEVTQVLTSMEGELDKEIAKAKKEEEGGGTPDYIKEDAPVTKIVATILRYAVDGGASDIHIEPKENVVRVRFRIDGDLQTSLELPNKVHLAVVARIKILSSLRLDERRKPQDGRFSANFDGRKIDFRVSTLPTPYGEKVVMRILDNEKGVTNLESTGISSHNLDVLRRMVNEPFGIILISGPTGSGKSTTLYAMLEEVDKVTKNVMSLEDPVEYNIDGVSQSQVRPEIGYSFANGLRTALRQDPDVILVGEIRDKETAQLAIQAALTGHLVLSTIHTNNSVAVIPRLVDMGVDPYLIAPTLKLAVAQRLARRICPNTGKPIPVEGSFKMMLDDSFESLPEKYRDRIPHADTVLMKESTPGCASGTKGRVAITETLEIDSEIQALILEGASEEHIHTAARKKGFVSLQEDAMIKALEHVIPYEEVSVFSSKVGKEDEEEVEPVAPEVAVADSQQKEVKIETEDSVDNLLSNDIPTV